MPGTTRAGPLPTSRPPRGAVLPGAPRRALGALLDRPWAVLVAWQVVLVAWQPRGGMAWLISWHYVITGVHAITGPFGLALYARHPELQMGPLTFLLSAPFVQLGRPADELAATAAMEALGLLAVAVLGGFVDRTTRADRIRWLLAGLGVLLGWHLLAVAFGHPDDALALLGVVLALRCLRSGAPLRAALALGLAIDCKPWVVPVVVVLAGAPRGSRLRAAAVLAATVAVVWLPFVIQPGAIEHVSRFTIVVAPTSTIHLLGLAGPRTPPWCRPAQLLVGAAAVAVVTARRRPEAALLAVVAVRLLLDPGAHGYYEAGLLLGTALLDLRARLPIATAIAILGVHLPPDLLSHAVPAQAVLRAAALVLVLLLALVVPFRGDAGEAPPLRRSRGA